MPSCGVTLLVNLQDDALRWRSVGGPLRQMRGIGLCGPQPAAFEIDTAQQRFIMGVEFKLGGAATLLRVAASELTRTHVSCEDISGRDATRLHEQLVAAPNAAARFALMETWLVDRINTAFRPRPIVANALSLLEHMPVRSAADQLNVSGKQLVRRFNDEIGMAPKLFSRVRRFERLIESVEPAGDISWANLCLSTGTTIRPTWLTSFASSPDSLRPSTRRDADRSPGTCRWTTSFGGLFLQDGDPARGYSAGAGTVRNGRFPTIAGAAP